MPLANLLKTRRIELGIKQQEISEKLGYGSPQFISNWERGISDPPPKKVRQLAKILELDPEIIFDEMERDFSKRLRA